MHFSKYKQIYDMRIVETIDLKGGSLFITAYQSLSSSPLVVLPSQIAWQQTMIRCSIVIFLRAFEIGMSKAWVAFGGVSKVKVVNDMSVEK